MPTLGHLLPLRATTTSNGVGARKRNVSGACLLSFFPRTRANLCHAQAPRRSKGVVKWISDSRAVTRVRQHAADTSRWRQSADTAEASRRARPQRKVLLDALAYMRRFRWYLTTPICVQLQLISNGPKTALTTCRIKMTTLQRPHKLEIRILEARRVDLAVLAVDVKRAVVACLASESDRQQTEVEWCKELEKHPEHRQP
ncbi:hypothetical protein B0H13DRAFT_2301280 [Mycena leptocephala]|nr:hypothetical protein B0H13DRAFT_2301280 [Mycena leptocephala]